MEEEEATLTFLEAILRPNVEREDGLLKNTQIVCSSTVSAATGDGNGKQKRVRHHHHFGCWL